MWPPASLASRLSFGLRLGRDMTAALRRLKVGVSRARQLQSPRFWAVAAHALASAHAAGKFPLERVWFAQWALPAFEHQQCYDKLWLSLQQIRSALGNVAR